MHEKGHRFDPVPRLGSIPWFYVSELFEQNARGKANALAVGTNWGTNFVVGYTFLLWKVWMETPYRSLRTRPMFPLSERGQRIFIPVILRIRGVLLDIHLRVRARDERKTAERYYG